MAFAATRKWDYANMTLEENNKRDETGSCLMLLLIVIWSFTRASADVQCQITAFLDFQMTFS